MNHIHLKISTYLPIKIIVYLYTMFSKQWIKIKLKFETLYYNIMTLVQSNISLNDLVSINIYVFLFNKFFYTWVLDRFYFV